MDKLTREELKALPIEQLNTYYGGCLVYSLVVSQRLMGVLNQEGKDLQVCERAINQDDTINEYLEMVHHELSLKNGWITSEQCKSASNED